MNDRILDGICPASSYHKVFMVNSVFASAANVFLVFGAPKSYFFFFKSEFGPNMTFLVVPIAPLPFKETATTSMS